MKVSIEKKEQGVIRIELITDTAKRPIVQELTPQQATFVAQMIGQAARADQFKFQVEL